MGGFLFQYGTAVHLALLTVAPLFLYAFCGPSTHAAVLFWLEVFGLMWIVMNPSPRTGEWPRDARHRIGWELARDPFLILCVLALVIAAVRAVNGGVALAYNAASARWYLKGPFVALLPGSVSGQGILPMAGVLGVGVVTLGVRHALGARARFAYLFLSAALAALAVVFWWILSRYGVSVPRLTVLSEDPFGLGSLLGVFLLFAVVSWVESWSFARPSLEVVSALSIAGLLVGLLFWSSAFARLVFATAALLTVLVGVCLAVNRRPPTAWFRTLISLAVIAVPVAFLFVEGTATPPLWPLFPEGFLPMREAASSVALEAWRGATRMGLGPGAYPLTFGFFATPEHWQVLSPVQTAAPNGWIHLLFERGLLGAVVVLAGLAILVRDGIVRYVRAGSEWMLATPHLLGIVVLLSVAAVTFVECSYVQVEALMPVGAALGLTAASFPESSEADHG